MRSVLQFMILEYEENMADIVRSVKGTRDFYPDNMAVRRWIFDEIRSVSSDFGYQEYEGPCLELIDLYAAKSGEELVKEQAFVFSSPGDDLLTLRPELTPTLARMVAQQQFELPFPLRWWSIGPFWRYEQPQRGRTREFYQWNIDLIGTESTASDAEIVAVAATFFRNIRLSPEKVQIFVNNRRLMDQSFAKIGIDKDLRPIVFRLVDKLDKLPPKEWRDYAVDNGITVAQVDSLEQLINDHQLWQNSSELIEFFELIEAFGVSEFVSFNPKVIRGLDYYTGTVFEAYELGGKSRAILGGGRYDNLVADVGGKPLPGVGFAMGDVVIELVLRDAGLIPSKLGGGPQVMVALFEKSILSDVLLLSNQLRDAGYRTVLYPNEDRLGKQFKFADKLNIPIVVILGPDELSSGQVAIKNLMTREQVVVDRVELLKKISEFLVKP